MSEKLTLDFFVKPLYIPKYITIFVKCILFFKNISFYFHSLKNKNSFNIVILKNIYYISSQIKVTFEFRFLRQTEYDIWLQANP